MARDIFIATFICISLMLMGCASNLGNYDSSVPQEQRCTLEIDKELFIRQFNDNDVNWNKFFHHSFDSVVQIPAGHHTFLMDYVSDSRLSRRYVKNVRFSYTFEAGKTYVIEPVISGKQISIEVITK